MHVTRNVARFATAVIAMALTIGALPSADAFPDKSIRLIVGFPPGGSSDAMARIVQQGLEKQLGQPVVVENKPGAGAMIAVDQVAKSAPDGYTIGLGGAGALGSNLGLGEKMPYDPRKDIAPVTGLAGSPFMLAAAPSLKGKSLRDIIAMAKADPGKLVVGHGGNGTLMHLTAEMLNQMAGTKVALVPYRGIAPVVSDLVGGHVALGIIDPPSGMAQIEAKQLKTIAVSSAKRFARLPPIPTLAESGLPGFESNGWSGIVAAGATPPDGMATRNTALVKVLKEPDVVERIRALGAEPMPMTPVEYGAFSRTEIDKWSKVVVAGKPN